jgi:UDP:flavonoid glycosyltransferase YjiC (YdhE family)
VSHYDLVLVLDPRLPGPEARSLVALCDALERREARIGLVPVRGAMAAPTRSFAPELRRRLDQRRLSWVDSDGPIRARTALGWHLAAFLHPPDRRLRLDAGTRILRLEHPARRLGGRPVLDLAAVARHARALLGGEFALAPTDPVVRASVAEHAGPSLADDLPPPVERLEIAPATGGEAKVVGRHGAIGGLAWPASKTALLAAYPAGAGLELRFAGCTPPPALDSGRLPPGWHWRAEEPTPIVDFLAGLDAWLALGNEDLAMPLSAAMAEALAAGRPVVGLPELAKALGEALVAPGPGGVVEALGAIPRAAGAAAQDLARNRLDPERLVRRLVPRTGAPRSAPARARRRVLMLSPNGIGMGHLTRQLAVARRLDPSIEPVFLTMSQAAAVVAEQGFHVEHTPYHTAYDGDVAQWNRALTERLTEMISFLDARLVLFDGNVPYQGLVAAQQAHPERAFVWLRRGMWRPGAGREAAARTRHFDLVIEPGDFAGEDDLGLTAQRRDEVVQVAPITLLDRVERLERTTARQRLGLRPDSIAVLVALGSGNNYDMASVRRQLLTHLLTVPDVEIVVAEWLIAQRSEALPEGVKELRTFPHAAYLDAFDLAIAAVGYNTFHELLEARLPTVFVPNENPMMDEQERRALWAERHGVARCARAGDPYRLRWSVDRLLDPAERVRIARACAALPACDGAREAARLLEELTSGVQARRARDPLAGTLPRGA